MPNLSKLRLLKSGFLVNWKPANSEHSIPFMVSNTTFKIRSHKNTVTLSLKGKLVSCPSKQSQAYFLSLSA